MRLSPQGGCLFHMDDCSKLFHCNTVFECSVWYVVASLLYYCKFVKSLTDAHSERFHANDLLDTVPHEHTGFQNVLLQDNKSYILLEKNGQALSSKQMSTRNILTPDPSLSLIKSATRDWLFVVPHRGHDRGLCNQTTLFCKFRDQTIGVVLAKIQDQMRSS